MKIKYKEGKNETVLQDGHIMFAYDIVQRLNRNEAMKGLMKIDREVKEHIINFLNQHLTKDKKSCRKITRAIQVIQNLNDEE